jgi:Tfp pilus assembly protein PilF
LRATSARFKPDDPAGGQRVVIMRGILEMRRGNLAAAVEHLREAVRTSPKYFEGRVMLTEVATYAGTPDATALADEAVEKWPDGRGWWLPYTARTLRAFLHMRAGQPDRARPLVDAVLEINRKVVDDGDRTVGPWYENAAIHLMLGDRAAALDAFERAVDAGFREGDPLEFDPKLAPLKDEPRFVAAVERVQRDLAEMRQRVDLSMIDEWVQKGAPSNATR